MPRSESAALASLLVLGTMSTVHRKAGDYAEEHKVKVRPDADGMLPDGHRGWEWASDTDVHHDLCSRLAEQFDLLDEEDRFPIWLSRVVEGIMRDIENGDYDANRP